MGYYFYSIKYKMQSKYGIAAIAFFFAA